MSRRGENIRKRKDGRWEGRYYTQGSQPGYRLSHSVYAKTYGEVKEKLSAAKLSAKNISKEQIKYRNICLHTAAEEWLAIIKSEKKHATYVKYRTVYEKYIQDKIGKVLLSELNPEILTDVFQRKDQMKLSNSLRNSISCVLNQILNYAVLYYQFNTIQYSCPKYRRENKMTEILSSDEQKRLFQYLYNEMDIYKLGIIICISTGLRLGEICSLKWGDINLEEKIMCVNTTVQRIPVEGEVTKTVLLEGKPKSTCSKREIPLSDELTELIYVYYTNAGEYVINKNTPMEPRTYQNKFQRYLRLAGVRKTNFHTLRHTFATNCVNGGVDIKSLSEILGHSDVKITLNRYVHPTVEIKRRHMNSLAAIYGQFLGQQ
ncbi:MAG: site-specific integrase [Dorea sp.]|nr:site-specific integrase [Dorea sp.]